MTRSRRRLVGAYVADGLLEWATSITLLVWAYDRTGSALAAGAMLVAKQAVPGLLTPFAGRLLDRRGPAMPLAGGLMLRAAATAALLTVDHALALLPLAAIAGTGGMLVRASLRTTVATRFDGDERRRVNAGTNTAMGVTSLAGPALGGMAVAATSATAVGFAAALAGMVSGFAVVLLASSALRAPASALANSGVGSRSGGRPPGRLAALACVAAIGALLAVDEPALLPYATDSLGGSAADYGLVLGAWGAGIIFGSLWLGRLGSRSMLAVAAWGTALVAASYLGLAAAPSPWLAAPIAVAGGVGNGLNWMALVTALQERTPEHAQGRLAADLEAVLAIGPPIGFLAGGLIADAAGPRAPFVVGGAGALLLLAAAFSIAARPPRLAPPIASGGRA